MKSQRFSRETFGARFIVRRMRGRGGPVAFATRSSKCGLNLINLHLKRKLLKQKLLKQKLLKQKLVQLMKSQHLSRETFGAQFIVRRVRGRGGSSGFRDEVPKVRLESFQPALKTETLKLKTLKTETLKT